MRRRGFLKALMGAPIAAPVVAREVTFKAGLSSHLTGGQFFASAATGVRAVAQVDGESHLAHLRRRMAALSSPDAERDFLRRHVVSRLDPDIAAARSLSLSAAMRLQARRDFAKQSAWEADHVHELIAEALRMGLTV